MNYSLALICVLFCFDDKPPIVSDFCALAGPQIQKLRRLTEAEARALRRPRHEAIRDLKQMQDRLCKSPSPMKNK